MRRFLKFAHEVGTVGLMGAGATQLVLSLHSDGMEPAALLTVREAILAISEWILLPSLMIVLVSGLLAMAAHPTYARAGWALIKLATTAVVLEGTLLAVQGPAQTAVVVAREIAAGDTSAYATMANIVRHERGGLGVLLFLSVANIALAVWRPKWKRKAKAG